YAELILLKQRLLGLWAGRSIAEGQASQMQVRLQGSADWTKLWTDLTLSAANLGLTNLCLDVNAPAIHEGYHARWDRRKDTNAEDPPTGHADMPLVVRGQTVGRLEIAGERNRVRLADTMAAATSLVEKIELAVLRLTSPPDEHCPSPIEEKTVSAPALAD